MTIFNLTFLHGRMKSLPGEQYTQVVSLVATAFLAFPELLSPQPKSQENPRQSEWLAFLRVVMKYFIKEIYFYFNALDMPVSELGNTTQMKESK